MFSTNLIILGIFSLISIISIIIQTGWKFTHKLVPKLPKNKRWSDILISTGHLSVIVFIFYTVNIWYWTDSSESRSDIWKMSETINLLESKVANASKYLSTSTNILSFNEAVNALPEEAEEYINALKEMRNFRGPELVGNLEDLIQASQCDGGLKLNVQSVCAGVRVTKREQGKMEERPIWPRFKQFMKNETTTYEAPFNDKREQIKDYLESVSEPLLKIAGKFKKKEQKLRNKMMETTNKKNKEFLFWYVIPSMIVFLFTLLSIYTTTFNPKLQSSLFVRILLNTFFYIVTIHVVIVFIYEFVANSNKCHPDPQSFDFSDFEIPSFNKSSKTFTKEDFLNCTAEKSHIFAAPNDEIFLPTTIYDDYMKAIPDTLLPTSVSPMSALQDAFMFVHNERRDAENLVPTILQHTVSCAPLRDFKENLEELVKSYEPIWQSVQPFAYDLLNQGHPGPGLQKLALFFINKGMPKMQNSIIASIQKYNDMINSTGFGCSSISNAFQHGYNRTCHVVNDRLIGFAKLVLIGFSLISIITHLLKNRKYENVIEKSKKSTKRR